MSVTVIYTLSIFSGASVSKTHHDQGVELLLNSMIVPLPYELELLPHV